MMESLIDFLSGAISLGFLTAGVFFQRFWYRTRDRLFSAFGLAFGLLGVGQAVQVFANIAEEEQSYVYLIRLAAFAIIIVAVVRKNREAA